VSAEKNTGTYYVRDPRGGLSVWTGSLGAYFYLFDGHGSVTGLTDSSVNVAATYAYDPCGQLTSMSGVAATLNPWRYVGAFQDGTSLYKMGQRYYDPSTG
jgi:hypothetical protein